MKKLYFVRDGDTIESIAQSEKVTVQDILDYNKIEVGNILSGVVLVIDKIDGDRYIVRPFDTLDKIAVKQNVPIDIIKKHNGIKEVFLGQVIYIPRLE